MNRRIITPIIFGLLLLGSKLIAQSPIIDSLEQELTLDQHDTTRAKMLSILCGEFRYTDPQKGMVYIKEAIQLLEKYPKEGKLQANAQFQIAVIYFLQNKQDSALLSLDNCLEIAKKNQLLRVQSGAYGLQGGIHERNYQLDKALQSFNESLNIAKELKDSSRLGAEYGNIANIYYRQENNESAERYAEIALNIAQIRKDTNNMLQPVYLLSGIASDPEKRIGYINLAIDICQKLNRLSTLALVYSSQGGYYFEEEKDYIKATESFKKGLRYSLQYNRKRSGASNANFLARCYLKTNQLDSVYKYAKLGARLGEETEAINQVINGYGRLSDYFEEVRQMDSAFFYLSEVAVLKDSLYESQLEEQVAEADAKFENEQARTEIAEQNLKIAQQKSYTNRIIAGALFLLLLAIAIFQWNYFRQRRKKREAEMALQLQKMEAQNLKELDRTKSRFFANLSHELRTPLTLILGPLKNALENKNPQQKDLQLAHNNGEKLLSLVNEIMDLSKLESGKLELYPSNVALVPFLKRLLMAYESAADTRNIALSLKTSLAENTTLRLDTAKLEKIIDNLLSNALKFSPNNSEIKMEVTQDNKQLRIAIQDQGIGIPAEDIPHLFDRFYQSNNQGEALQGGTGIGLALAKELTLLHNGNITVDSTVGQGSTFMVALPFEEVAQQKSIEKEELVEAIQNPYASNVYQALLLNNEKAKVLIVEDNKEMRAFIQEILSPYFYCLTANDGAEGLRVLEQSKVDLVISDVMMPNMDGFTFREKVNQHPQYKYLPFVMLTARAEEDDKIKGLQMGVDDYIAKPFGTRELIARVHNLLKNKIERELAFQADPTLANEEKETADERFIKEVEQSIIKHLDEVEFKVVDLAKEVGYSQRQLSRVLKRITGMSPVEFILELRLQKAYQLIMQQRYLSVSEVRYDVGIESASYFSKKFTERFGESPSNLLKKA